MIFYLLKEKSMKIKRSDLEAIIKEEIIDTLSEQVGDAADRALPAAMHGRKTSRSENNRAQGPSTQWLYCLWCKSWPTWKFS